jgi:hypothetical protein
VATETGPVDIVVHVEQDAGDHTEALRFAGTLDVLPPTWRHDLPAAMVLGEAAQLNATIHIDPLSEEGPAPRVSADLRGLGGPANIDLVAVGGGDYTLQAVVELDVPSRDRQIFVRFEQEVGGIVYAHDFAHDVIVSPPDLRILDDALSEGWQLLADGGAEILGTTEAGPVYNGRRSLALLVKPENFFSQWSAEWLAPTPVDPFGFAGIRFAIHTGEATASVPSALSVIVDDLSVDLLVEPHEVRIGSAEWQIVEIPFEDFTIGNYYQGQEDFVVEEIGSIRLQGTLKGALYVDDVRVVTSIPAPPPSVPTAVSEVVDSTTPDDFELGPSYPNPFNAETVIRFSLPQAAATSLSVYNLAGQRVVDLIDGRVEAGIHQVRWDGRGPSGAELATGVYLVRLSAGRWTASEKVLLLR